MNGVEKITEKILADAKQEAERILREASDKANALKDAKSQKAAEKKDALLKEYAVSASELKRRMISVAQLDLRKETLRIKQELIDQSFVQCLTSIASLPSEAYRKMTEDLLVGAVVIGTEEVVLSKGDEGRLGNDFIAGVNKRLRLMGKNGALKASAEKGSFQGGFILRIDRMELNYTFESVLRVIREEMEPQVATMLF